VTFQPSIWEPEWWKEAACAHWGVDPEIFAAKKRGRPTTRAQDPWAEAKKVCGRCPVRKKCLDDVLSSDPTGDSGRYEMFQGGLSPDELTMLRRRMTRRANR
jgi:WhiB family redox-sensing transcriptional regulator